MFELYICIHELFIRDQRGRRNWSDARDGNQPPTGVVLLCRLLDHRIGLLDPQGHLIEFQLQLGQQ